MFRILIVDDDPALCRSMTVFLLRNGFEAKGCTSADEAMNAMFDQPFDLVISDIMMPGTDGYSFSRAIREQDENIPILFVTARDDFASKQKGFAIGIDDYMTKPVDLEEMLLRIQALLRRAMIHVSKTIELGDFRMDQEEHTAYCGGEEIPLSAREFDILFRLLSNPKKTFSRTQLMNEFWEGASEAGTRTVDVYMTRIRSKTSACTAFEIKTVHGLGYKAVIKDE